MTVHHLAAGDDLNCQLTELQYKTLLALNLIAPCHDCTSALVEGSGDDEVVHHPDVSRFGRPPSRVEAEIRAVLQPKKH